MFCDGGILCWGWVLVVKLPTLFPFFLFIPRCLGYSLVALVPSDFLIKVSFLFKLISLRLSKAGVHNIDVFMMWNILMSYILSLSDQMLFAPAIITLSCFFSSWGKCFATPSKALRMCLPVKSDETELESLFRLTILTEFHS